MSETGVVCHQKVLNDLLNSRRYHQACSLNQHATSLQHLRPLSLLEATFLEWCYSYFVSCLFLMSKEWFCDTDFAQSRPEISRKSCSFWFRHEVLEKFWCLLMTDAMLHGKNSKSRCQHFWLLCVLFSCFAAAVLCWCTLSTTMLLLQLLCLQSWLRSCDQNCICVLSTYSVTTSF